ncbi:hypothetical protein C8Q76DRAFT_585922, partial [Earliella scabrosa]
LMRAHGAIISGSVALSYFLDEEFWTPGDLDIYVPDRLFTAFVKATTRDDAVGFRSCPRIRSIRSINDDSSIDFSDIGGLNGIKDVQRFRTVTGRYVDIIRSPIDTPVAPLHSFWSTLVTNFLTPDGCGCGFPEGTVYRRGFIK